ncbi:MAG: hypothetical protein ACYTEL_18110 [Planctomycetota bacterium]
MRDARPWVYWFCYDNAIKKEEAEREIMEMAAAGIGGAELRFVEFAWWRKKVRTIHPAANWAAVL